MQTATITAPATPTCATCPEFQRSETLPSVGCCLLSLENVLSQDIACSQFYQEEAPIESENDEF